MSLPKCAHSDCENTADPRWFALCKHGSWRMVCDGHLATDPKPEEHPETPYVNPCACHVRSL